MIITRFWELKSLAKAKLKLMAYFSSKQGVEKDCCPWRETIFTIRGQRVPDFLVNALNAYFCHPLSRRNRPSPSLAALSFTLNREQRYVMVQPPWCWCWFESVSNWKMYATTHSVFYVCSIFIIQLSIPWICVSTDAHRLVHVALLSYIFFHFRFSWVWGITFFNIHILWSTGLFWCQNRKFI